jgi:hypothetical protein
MHKNCSKWGPATPWRLACRHARRRQPPCTKTVPNGGRLRHGGSHVAIRAAARPHAQKLFQMGASYAMAARMSPCSPPPGPIQLLNQLIAFCVKPGLSFQKFRRLSEPSSFHSQIPETFATVIVSFKSLLAITFINMKVNLRTPQY